MGVNCTSTCAEEQSPDSLIQSWLSGLRRTFTCHLVSPRPRELTVSLEGANTLVTALPPHSNHTSSLARFPPLNGTRPSYYLSAPSDPLHETKTLPRSAVSHLASSLTHTLTFGNQERARGSPYFSGTNIQSKLCFKLEKKLMSQNVPL